MDNLLINSLKKAQEKNWCTKFLCTTCGAIEFRTELQNISGEERLLLVDDLKEINIAELEKQPNWKGGLLIALHDLQIKALIDEILDTWLSIKTEHLIFYDFVLFKVINNLPKQNPVRSRWINRCAELALETKDFSLVESLILVLESDAIGYPELISIANEYAKKSMQMKRVLFNTGLN